MQLLAGNPYPIGFQCEFIPFLSTQQKWPRLFLFQPSVDNIRGEAISVIFKCVRTLLFDYLWPWVFLALPILDSTTYMFGLTLLQALSTFT